MLAETAILVASPGIGIAAQRAFRGDRKRRLAWNVFFWTLTSAIVFYAFTSVPLERELGLALAAAVLASSLRLLVLASTVPAVVVVAAASALV